MKTKTLLIAAVMFLGISVAAFAQVGQIATYTVGYVPVPTVVSYGHTEKAGDITFTTISTSGPTVTGTITVTYSLQVTYNGTIVYMPPAIQLGNPPTFGPPTLDATGKKLTFSITPDPTNPEPLYGFDLTGVRLDVVGAGTPLRATIATTGNAIVSGQSNVEVITSSDHGLKNFTISPTSYYDTLGGLLSGGTATLDITEGFPWAFGKTLADDPTQNITQMIKIRIDQAIPAGVTITFPQYDSSGNWELARVDGTIDPSYNHPDAYHNAVYYRLIHTTDQVTTETFELDNVAISVTPTAFPTYVPGSITASATFAILDEDFIPYNTSSIPRYAKDYVTANIPLITFTPKAVHTYMMIPFATTEVGYDTGIAIANTTTDPLTTASDISPAFPQNGKIVFYCYNNDGTLITIDTSDPAVQAVLDADDAWLPLTSAGILGTGKSYAVLLSQLLAAGGAPGVSFHGYIIIVTDFTNGHGQYFLTNWDYFTNGAQILVLVDDRSDVPEAGFH